MGSFGNLFAKIMGGTQNEREVRRLWPIVEQVNGFADGFQQLTDDELKAKTQEFKYRLRMGETLDDILPEAFAAVKETCRRLCGKKWLVRGHEQDWNMVPYDVQILGAIVLHEGKIAEMATGEGKTLVATMPLYLNALSGKGAHLVTVNDYLAQRDCEWMGKIYEFLGLTASALHNDMEPEERRQAYQADITYGTNNEFGFDYLRDNMAVDVWSVVQRKQHYAIVDEVDSVLIDESRTPLIISGSVGAPRNVYYELKPTVANLYRRQQELIAELFREGQSLLEKDEDNAGLYLLRVLRGDPKNPQLLELLTSEFWVKKLIEKLQGQYEVNKEMGVVDSELYYTIDEKSHVVDITEKGRIFLSGGRDQDIVEKIQSLDELDERLGSIAEQKNARQYFDQDPVSGLCNGIALSGRVALCGAGRSLQEKHLTAVEKLKKRLAAFPSAINEAAQNKKTDKAAAARQFFTYSSKIEKLVNGLSERGRALLLEGDADADYRALVETFAGLLAGLDAGDQLDRAEADRRKEQYSQFFELDKSTFAPGGLNEEGITALLTLHLGGDPALTPYAARLDDLLRGKRTATGEEGDEHRQEYFEFGDKGAVPKHISEKGRIALLGGNPDLYILPDRSLVEDRDRQTQELLDRTLNQSGYDYVERVMAIENLEKDLEQLYRWWQASTPEERGSFFRISEREDGQAHRVQLLPRVQAILEDYAAQTNELAARLDQILRGAKGDTSQLLQTDKDQRVLGFTAALLDRLLGVPFEEVRKKIAEWQQQPEAAKSENPQIRRRSLDDFLRSIFPSVASAQGESLSRLYEEVERMARMSRLVFEMYYQGDMTPAERLRYLRRFFQFDSQTPDEALRLTGLSDSGLRLLSGAAPGRAQVAARLFTLVGDADVDPALLFEIDDQLILQGLKKSARSLLLEGLPYFSFTEELARFRDEVFHLTTKKVNTRAELDSLLPKDKAHLRGKHYLFDERELNELIFKAHAPNAVITSEEIEHWCRIHFERKPRRLLEEQRDRKWRDYTLVEERVQNISQLLRAYTLYHKDVEYVVKALEDADLRGRAAGQKGAKAVIIVDQFTGRLMPGRRFSDGLHEALEAKEGVEVQAETQTLATITIQNFFRIYERLAGMTGTAETEAQEFFSTYKLEVVVIPTNRPVVRADNNDVIYRTKREKYNAIIDEALAMHEAGRPVLVGTISVDVSQRLSEMLTQRGVPIANWLKKGDVSQELESGRFHTVLNAKFHKQEAEIIAKAGLGGTITIATNMAGRGTDIKLQPEVIERGGLHIIGSEKHEARRIDRQLRGRSGRQGDPGSSRFYLSLEDDLMRLFGSDRITNIMSRLGPAEENERIEHPLITRSIERAQKKVEERNFEIRKNLLEYDNVLNEQRKIIYKRRQNLLGFAGAEDYVESKAKRFINEEDDRADWNLQGLIDSVESFFRRPLDVDETDLTRLTNAEIKTHLREWVEVRLQEDQLQRQLQLRHRLLGYCRMEELIEELVRLKIRLHNAGTRDTAKWNFPGIRDEFERIFSVAPDWLESDGPRTPAAELEKRIVEWARQRQQSAFQTCRAAFDLAVFSRVDLPHLLHAYVDGLLSMHLDEQVPPISWNVDEFLNDLERLAMSRPTLGANELRTIRREKLRQMLNEWIETETKAADPLALRHRVVGYFSSLNFIDVLVHHLFQSQEEGRGETLSAESSRLLTAWFGHQAADLKEAAEDKTPLPARLAGHLRRLYLAELAEQQEAYHDYMLVRGSIEEFIASSVSSVTKRIAGGAGSSEEKTRSLNQQIDFMLLQRPAKNLPSHLDEAAIASFSEDMVSWALNLYHTFSEREERLRQSALSGEIVRDSVLMMIEDTIYNSIRTAMENGSELDANQMRRLEADCRLVFRQSPRLGDDGGMMYDPNQVMKQIGEWAQGLYNQRVRELGPDLSTRYERYFVLEKIDENWRQHLNATDELREGIGLRGYGQKDPLLEYKSEAYNLFVKMIDRIDREVVSTLFRAFDVGGEMEEQQLRRAEPKNFMTTHSQVEVFKQVMGGGKPAEASGPSAAPAPRPAKAVKGAQVGRNDPCPCGSGKKYKQCCGKNL